MTVVVCELAISDDEKRRIDRVIAHANAPENLYVPWSPDPMPGLDPRHVVELGNMKCVFSRTQFIGELRTFRHLSISRTDSSRLPSPQMCLLVAGLFGFDVSSELSMGRSGVERCIVVAQAEPSSCRSCH